MLKFLKDQWKFLVVMVLITVVFIVSYQEFREWRRSPPSPPPAATQPNIIINTAGEQGSSKEPQVIYVESKGSSVREFVYVPKEIDPQTGKKETTDVEFIKQAGKLYVKVNGKEFEVPVDVQEAAKFENGKLVITETTEMRLNITAPKPSINVGIGASNHGLAVMANGPLYKNVSWWVYGDSKTVAGGIQFPIMK